MFSGIVEDAIEVVGLRHDESNLHITLRCPFADELRIDQSISHNGVCLTVVSLPGGQPTLSLQSAKPSTAQILAALKRATR